jgi:hypothetical protein
MVVPVIQETEAGGLRSEAGPGQKWESLPEKISKAKKEN